MRSWEWDDELKDWSDTVTPEVLIWPTTILLRSLPFTCSNSLQNIEKHKSWHCQGESWSWRVQCHGGRLHLGSSGRETTALCSNVLQLILNRSPLVGSHEHHVQLDGGLCLCQGICEGTWDFGYPIFWLVCHQKRHAANNSMFWIYGDIVMFGYLLWNIETLRIRATLRCRATSSPMVLPARWFPVRFIALVAAS